MTTSERVQAFELRCRGFTWEAIGAALHYDGRTVAQDLWRVMRKPPHVPPVIYPLILDHVQRKHRGSINAFASALGVAPARLRAVLIRGEMPDEALRKKICGAVGAPEKEVFTRGT